MYRTKGRSEEAKVFEAFRLGRSDALRLRSAATVLEKPPSTLTREILIRWLDNWEIEGCDKSAA